MVRNWTRRWFQLRAASLTYRKSPTGRVRGSIDLARVTACFAFDGDTNVLIALKTDVGKDFLLMAGTKAEADAWVDAIRNAALQPRSAAELLSLSHVLKAEGVLDDEVGPSPPVEGLSQQRC